MKTVQFHNVESIRAFRNRSKFKAFIDKLVRHERKKLGHLDVIFCSDKYLLEMNRSFLGHDYYTDVITFDLAASDGFIQGEIYISVDRVKDNAKIFNSSFSRELHRVMIHGVLHLCGYNDKLKSQKAQMRQMEDRYLNKYFISHR